MLAVKRCQSARENLNTEELDEDKHQFGKARAMAAVDLDAHGIVAVGSK
jgi:hypothetical protein